MAGFVSPEQTGALVEVYLALRTDMLGSLCFVNCRNPSVRLQWKISRVVQYY